MDAWASYLDTYMTLDMMGTHEHGELYAQETCGLLIAATTS